MRSIRAVFFSTMTAAGFWACDELPILGPETLHKINFPLGRSWVYLDSVKISGINSAIFVREVIVTATPSDSLSPELRNLVCLKVTVREGDSLTHSTVWYRHDDKGLWEVAFQNEETVFAFPRVDAFSGSIEKQIGLAQRKPFRVAEQNKAELQQITFRPEPRLVVKYPLQTGMEWIAFKTPFQRTLRCVKYSTVAVPAGEFTAFKLEGRGDLNPATDFVMFDYYCSEGLVRRELHWRNLEAYTPSGHPRPHPFDIDETIVLVDIVG